MFVQTQITPNPNSIKVFCGEKWFRIMDRFEITKDQTNNELIRNLLRVRGVEGIFWEKILYL